MAFLNHFFTVILFHSVTKFALSSLQKCDSPEENKFDCLPSGEITEANCIQRDCCWQPVKLSGVPFCFFPLNSSKGYYVTTHDATPTDQLYFLELSESFGWPDEFARLTVNLSSVTSKILRIRIAPTAQSRYEVPLDIRPNAIDSGSQQTEADYEISVTKIPFSLKVVRRKSKQPVFDSSVAPLVFADQYVRLSTGLSSNVVYGLGEHRGPLLLPMNWERLSMWASDQPPAEHAELYGSHPFLLNIEPHGSAANGLFLLNSNAMDFQLQPSAATVQTTGGILDFYLILGDTPDAVVEQYTMMVGPPIIPPYWALGFHLCRWGYGNANTLQSILHQNRNLSIPIDVVWTDIEYMDAHRDFTVNASAWSNLAQIVGDAHSRGQRFIPIVDPAISDTSSAYEPYRLGIELDIFIKNSSGMPAVGAVWPGPTVFPDFSHPNASAYWRTMLGQFHSTVPFDGIWIDMNEPSSFVDGSVHGCPAESRLNHPPYVPRTNGGTLFGRTLCPSYRQHVSTHYDAHNMYGWWEGRVTRSALDELLGERSLLISRSTFPGFGRFGGHWTGDNLSSWPDLASSVSAVLNFQLFGIPMVGADICGFRGQTSEELCVRWHQLGAVYPFMRNHNTIGARRQDPAAFSPAAVGAIRAAIQLRYRLIPHIYTLAHWASVSGAPMLRPMSFEHTADRATMGIQSQFMLGHALMAVPVLAPSAVSVRAYLPAHSRWFHFSTGRAYRGEGRNVSLPARVPDGLPVLLQAGHVVALRSHLNSTLTTRDAESLPYELKVPLSSNGSSHGWLYLDDGVSLGRSRFSLVRFASSPNGSCVVLANSLTEDAFQPKCDAISLVEVFGVDRPVSGVWLNDQSVQYSYQKEFGVLTVAKLAEKMHILTPFRLKWCFSSPGSHSDPVVFSV